MNRDRARNFAPRVGGWEGLAREGKEDGKRVGERFARVGRILCFDRESSRVQIETRPDGWCLAKLILIFFIFFFLFVFFVPLFLSFFLSFFLSLYHYLLFYFIAVSFYFLLPWKKFLSNGDWWSSFSISQTEFKQNWREFSLCRALTRAKVIISRTTKKETREIVKWR